MDMSCLEVFQPGTLNPTRLSSSQAEPLNLSSTKVVGRVLRADRRP